MKRTDTGTDVLFGLTQSAPDSNRLYSILLDARASSASENVYDIAEKILVDEKENAKNALEKLWALKKNMQAKDDTRTIDLLIDYYQTKIDVLRNKEEIIKKISRQSRDLLEEKRKKDTEIASIKQEIDDSDKELSRLNEKLARARTKEQELILIDSQLKKELSVNENDVISGLYEIIMSHERISADAAPTQQPAAAPAARPEAQPKSEEPATETPPAADPMKNAEQTAPIDLAEIKDEDTAREVEEIHALYQQLEKDEPELFPKSVVKTTRGVVIGEYYYDPQVYKNKRHYIFNSLYFMEQLTRAMETLRNRFDQTVYSEALQMVQDAYRRVSGNTNLHFEISTNEIINEKSLKDLWRNLKERTYADVISFANRLRGKISVLAANYRIMLKEQMERYAQ